jgi:hypothetical protein
MTSSQEEKKNKIYAERVCMLYFARYISCMSKRKLQKEIDKEIATLKGMVDKIPPFTAFGDSNVERIEAEIRVLEESMDEDDVFDTFDDGSEAQDAARNALLWREGNEDESPSEGWKPLVKNK